MAIKGLPNTEANLKVAAERFQQLDTQGAMGATLNKLFGGKQMTRDEAAGAMQKAFGDWRAENPSGERRDAIREWCNDLRPNLYAWLSYHHDH